MMGVDSGQTAAQSEGAARRTGEITQHLLASIAHVAGLLVMVAVLVTFAWQLRQGEGGAGERVMSNGLMLLAIAQLFTPSTGGFWLTLIMGRADAPGADGLRLAMAFAYVALVLYAGRELLRAVPLLSAAGA